MQSTGTGSLAIWARSPSFTAKVNVYAPNGTLIATDTGGGWTPSGDVGNASLNFSTSIAGDYQVQLSSSNGSYGNGTYSTLLSPGIDKLVVWQGRYKTDVYYVSSSGCIGVSGNAWGGGLDQSILLWNISSSAVQMVNYDWPYVNGSCYSPVQDRIFEYVTGPNPYPDFMVEYDNTGSVVVSHSLASDFNAGTMVYDYVHDRIFSHNGFGGSARWSLWDCATRTTIASGSNIPTHGNPALGCTYSEVDNRFYIAWHALGNANTQMSWVDASTFAVGSTANSLSHDYIIYEPATKTIWATSGAGIVVIDPLTDTVVSTIVTNGAFGGVSLDPCTGYLVVAVDFNTPSGLIIVDPSASYAVKNFIQRSSVSSEYFYTICHAQLDSKIYMTSDDWTTESSSLWSCKISNPTGSTFVYPNYTDEMTLGVTSGSAILNWTYYSSSQQGFNVERSSSADVDWVPYATIANPNSRSYTDTNVTESISGSTYRYRMNSYYMVGTGSYSNSASITFTTPPPLGPENVINGGFETNVFAPDWTTGGAGAGDVNISSGGSYVHSGTYGVQAGPWNGQTGYLSQVITLAAGTYTLSFWLNSYHLNSGTTMFRVYWEGVQIANLDAENVGWTQYTYTVTATGPTSEVKFDMRNEPDYYGLDDVSVR